MSNQKLLVESLAMDLKRVSLGYYRGSNIMAKRFKEEALKRSAELEKQDLNIYLKKLLLRTKKALNCNEERTAEDILMYSTLFQNFALYKMGSSTLIPSNH